MIYCTMWYSPVSLQLSPTLWRMVASHLQMRVVTQSPSLVRLMVFQPQPLLGCEITEHCWSTWTTGSVLRRLPYLDCVHTLLRAGGVSSLSLTSLWRTVGGTPARHQWDWYRCSASRSLPTGSLCRYSNKPFFWSDITVTSRWHHYYYVPAL